MDMKSYQEQLHEWLKANRPDVFVQIEANGVYKNSSREILNRTSGINVRMLDTIEDGCKKFLEAFKAAAKV